MVDPVNKCSPNLIQQEVDGRSRKITLAGPAPHSRTHLHSSPSEGNEATNALHSSARWLPTPARSMGMPTVLSGIAVSMTTSKCYHEKNTSCNVMLPRVAPSETAM